MSDKQIMLVTGANRGLGKDVVAILASTYPDAVILLGTRSLENGKVAADEIRKSNKKQAEIVPFQLDVTSKESIQNAVTEIRNKYSKLNVLINNSGVSHFGSKGKDIAIDIMKVNYYGVKELTQAMLPLIPTDGSGRIVVVSSEVGAWAHDACPQPTRSKIEQLNKLQASDIDALVEQYVESVGDGNPGAEKFPDPAKSYGPYGASKMFVSTLCRLWARDLKAKKIAVAIVCPGYCKTELNMNSGPRTTRVGARSIIYGVTIPLEESGGFYQDGHAYPMANPQPDIAKITEAAKKQNEDEDKRWEQQNI